MFVNCVCSARTSVRITFVCDAVWLATPIVADIDSRSEPSVLAREDYEDCMSAIQIVPLHTDATSRIIIRTRSREPSVLM
jgi:hypothetical protein